MSLFCATRGQNKEVLIRIDTERKVPQHLSLYDVSLSQTSLMCPAFAKDVEDPHSTGTLRVGKSQGPGAKMAVDTHKMSTDFK